MDLATIFSAAGTGLGSIFGTGVILGIVGILIYFYIAYKFEFPAILNMIIVGIAGYLIGATFLGSWIMALAIMGLALAIAMLGYRLLSG